ncbi:hypothetical protein KR018_002585 [Drosophila ironensis]|nr:hypothetical protein KR018_002585 [Drosophila ironensis]
MTTKNPTNATDEMDLDCHEELNDQLTDLDGTVLLFSVMTSSANPRNNRSLKTGKFVSLRKGRYSMDQKATTPNIPEVEKAGPKKATTTTRKAPIKPRRLSVPAKLPSQYKNDL